MARKTATTPKFTLTHENYFSKERPHISNSQISDYIASPAYYHLKHVLHGIENDSTPSMRLGAMVDALLTDDKFPWQAKVLKSEDKELYEYQQGLPEEYLVSQAQVDEARAISLYVKSQDFWRTYSPQRQFQPILTGKLMGYPICGKLDILDFSADGKTAYVDDGKVTSQSHLYSKDSWTRHCFKMGYFRQLALYGYLVKKKYRKVKKIVYRHYVISKERPSLYRVHLFTFSEHLIEAAMRDVEEALRGIGSRAFGDPPISWNGATHVVHVEELTTTPSIEEMDAE